MQLRNSQCPILDWLCPFFIDTFDDAENQLKQCVISGESALGFCVFLYLAVESFDGICGVNHFADFGGILKIIR